MTTEIMEQWLRYFNADMRSQNRNVLIFLDNAACHPKIELSNTKILMLPPNTTSITQPMDQGVIYTFKSYYRKFLLQSLLCKMDNCSSAHQLAKSISVLDAVNWIALACDNVKAECVQNCINCIYLKYNFFNTYVHIHKFLKHFFFTSLRRKTLYNGKIVGPKRFRYREVLLYLFSFKIIVQSMIKQKIINNFNYSYINVTGIPRHDFNVLRILVLYE